MSEAWPQRKRVFSASHLTEVAGDPARDHASGISTSLISIFSTPSSKPLSWRMGGYGMPASPLITGLGCAVAGAKTGFAYANGRCGVAQGGGHR